MLRKIEKAARDLRYRVVRKTYSYRVPTLKHRREIPHLLNAKGLVNKGAEIGVKEGKFSEFLLSIWKGKELVSIDPWMTADAEEYVDRANVSQPKHNEFYEETLERLRSFGARSKIMRTTSLEAAQQISDQSLDFCYVDARHDYENVLEDLRAWYPKVKKGGLFAGHDYLDGMIEGSDFGVKKAVNQFASEHGLRVKSTLEKDYPSWYLIKG